MTIFDRMKNILIPILLFTFFSCCRKAPEKKQEIQFFLQTNYRNDTIHIDSVDHHNIGDSLLAMEYFELNGTGHGILMFTNDFHASIDGNYVIYELDDLGTIYTKSLTWKNYARLKTSNDSINEIIDAALENIILNPRLQYRSSDHIKRVEEMKFTVPTVSD